jgi:hypothetical protein
MVLAILTLIFVTVAWVVFKPGLAAFAAKNEIKSGERVSHVLLKLEARNASLDGKCQGPNGFFVFLAMREKMSISFPGQIREIPSDEEFANSVEEYVRQEGASCEIDVSFEGVLQIGRFQVFSDETAKINRVSHVALQFRLSQVTEAWL